eukprot:CAMPEP_0117423996 /NCGR_PEP_ID=MMETSP0758-20121206/4509_1 /TAXON_ID=63605 /ORGANISM="Percolomonas cosmopolitus, Strain AE-1 (ATCC 50343)" /LENGTH=1268 /DNA_ID=CAMNT_0005207521 /DNA_START=876 /DNA_END=4678 /DNA_ORIENTATION=-
MKKREKQIKKEEQEIRKVKAEGGNPYELMRDRKVKKTYIRGIKQREKKIENKKKAIYDQVAYEREQTEKEMKDKQKKKKMAQDWKDSISRSVQEEKTRKYLLEHTKTGADTIDPLGALQRIHPSQHMVVRRKNFGVHGTAAETDPEYFAKLLATQKNVKSDERATQVTGKTPLLGAGAGLSKIKVKAKEDKDDDESSDEELAGTEEQGLWGKPNVKTKRSFQPIDSDDDVNPLDTVPEMTTLEKQYLTKAKQRKKDNLYKEQVCWGKTFKGEAFIASPATILFKDFDINQTYKKKFTLTNVSLTFNYFKVLELPHEIQNFIEVKYKPKGKMSAGTSATLEVIFQPRIEEDIHSYIPIRTQTGPIQIPLHCLIKKVDLSMDTPKGTDFGAVMLAESNRLTFKLTNAGALDTSYKIEGDALLRHNVPVNMEFTEKRPTRFLRFSSDRGFVDHHGSTTFSIDYFPQQVHNFETNFTLKFEDRFTDDIHVVLKGEGTDVSIYLESEQIDFRTTCFGTMYRDILRVHNRSRGAMKVEFKIPKALKNTLEFVPNLGYVQPGKPFDVYLKFQADKAILLQRAKKYITKKTKDNIEYHQLSLPIPVLVPDQTMPVSFTLESDLTTDVLDIEPREIDFGKCSIDEAIQLPLIITNNSLLQQEFGFIRTPDFITISPNDGFTSILPGETMTLQVTFKPLSAIDYHFRLRLKSHRNVEINIPCHGEGVQLPVSLSKRAICTRAVAMGDIFQTEFSINNRSKKPYDFRFELSEEQKNMGIDILPKEGHVEAGQSASLLVRYTAPTSRFKEVEYEREVPIPVEEQEPAGKKKGKKKVEEDVPQTRIEKYTVKEDQFKGWETSLEDELFSVHHSEFIPCYLSNFKQGALSLQLDITLIAGIIVPEFEGKAPISQLNFGSLPVHDKKVYKFKLKNMSSIQTVNLTHEPLEYGPFKILKPARPLKPKEVCEVEVIFQSAQAIKSSQLLRIHASRTDINGDASSETQPNPIQIELIGEAFLPELTIEPNVDVYDFGAVGVNQHATKPLTLSLTAPQPTPFQVFFENETCSNRDDSCVFTATPSQGVTPAELILSTRVDQPITNVLGDAKIVFGGSVHTKRIHLASQIVPHGLYIRTENDILKEEKPIEQVPTNPFAPTQADGPTMLYTKIFTDVKFEESRSFSFTIGHTHSDEGKIKGDFEFAPLSSTDSASGFKVDTLKGSVDAGSEKAITVSFTANEQTFGRLPVPGVDVWVELLLKGTLKDASGTRQFNFAVRAQCLSSSRP